MSNTKAAATASIKTRNTDNKLITIKCKLYKDRNGVFRWYDDASNDMEISGKTVKKAKEELEKAGSNHPYLKIGTVVCQNRL